jgi:hypothetical protein
MLARDEFRSSRLKGITRADPERVFFTLALLTAADNTANAMSMIRQPITPRIKITAFDSAERKRGEGIGGINSAVQSSFAFVNVEFHALTLDGIKYR